MKLYPPSAFTSSPKDFERQHSCCFLHKLDRPNYTPHSTHAESLVILVNIFSRVPEAHSFDRHAVRSFKQPWSASGSLGPLLGDSSESYHIDQAFLKGKPQFRKKKENSFREHKPARPGTDDILARDRDRAVTQPLHQLILTLIHLLSN